LSSDQPFHLKGNFLPVKDEVTSFDLPIEGALPPELSGLYVRQGSNPISGKSVHWFLGDGMTHGIRLEKGRAAWYRNRYVKTPYLDDPNVARVSETGQFNRKISYANTHILRHAGRLLALEEVSFPYELDPELETLGFVDFDGKLETGFTAHPKICPVTGEMLGFGYGMLPPHLVYHRISPDGKLVQSEEIEVGGPTMMHDFAISERHVIFMDLPVLFDLESAFSHTMPFRWSDDYPTRMGIMPRTGRSAEVKWFEVNPCYIFHTLNAWDEGNSVVLDACRYDEIWREVGDMGSVFAKPRLHRFSFDLNSGSVKEEALDDRLMEFPRVAKDRVGQKNRFGFVLEASTSDDGSPNFSGVVKFDLQEGKSETHHYGERFSTSEPCFVPAAGAATDSDEGWIMSYVHDENTNETSFTILDATNLGAEPVARVKLPQRVPYGFHGSWLPDAE